MEVLEFQHLYLYVNNWNTVQYIRLPNDYYKLHSEKLRLRGEGVQLINVKK